MKSKKVLADNYSFIYVVYFYSNQALLIMNFKSQLTREKHWFLRQRPSSKIIFILLGILSTLWFLVRVIPKPSRAAYPCMQAAAPFAAAFVTYLSGLMISVSAFRFLTVKKEKRNIFMSMMAFAAMFMGVFLMMSGDHATGLARSTGQAFDDPNDPIGIARGIFPGRVVWVWNPEATNENCTNEPGDYWFQDENTDQQVIREMLSRSLQLLSGQDSDSLAWDALFKSYNESHGNGSIGYQPGQKIAIKINLTTGGESRVDLTTYEKINDIEMMDSTPQLVVEMLRQLIEIFGISEEDISIGDPIRHYYNEFWDRCHSLYPDVKYLDRHGYLGRTKAVATPEPVIFYADGTISDSLPAAYIEADYMINMGCLKQHNLAAGTFCAKNHYGSICRDWASHLHYALPSPTVNGFENLGYGKFRNLVDLMEHKDLGEKTMLFVVDGIWGGDLPVCEPVKWQIDPFNDDWPNSLFVSQDHVAIESVGMDFVMAQFNDYADMEGGDDYLHQAADSSNWAEGITYDPENDGMLIPSLGVHEHWNNDIDKEYTRNLGIGDGIELLKYLMTDIKEPNPDEPNEAHAYPNPFSGIVNIEWAQDDNALSAVEVFDANGRMIDRKDNIRAYNGRCTFKWEASETGLGIYYYRIIINDASGRGVLQGKLISL